MSESNPGGVRFGSAELYDVVELCFKSGSSTVSGEAHVVVDCLAIGQAVCGGADERVILFVRLHEGYSCTDELQKLIREEIRKRRSARHVPERVSSVRFVTMLFQLLLTCFLFHSFLQMTRLHDKHSPLTN